MKASKRIIAALAVGIATVFGASAQYYQLINQATDMISTAVRGGANYRGFVDVSYLSGIGNKNASFIDFTTTQGVKTSNVFFWGVGAGVDYMITTVNDGYFKPSVSNSKKNGVMIPLFTDFRLNFGDPTSAGFFVDLKVGAGFYVSNKYILVGDGYINSSESFLLRPSIGCRIPVSKANPKLAFNFGATYQLLTNSYWYNPNGSNSITLSSLGAHLSFEW